MGNCSSCESTTDVVMAKVILQDGRLQEFACPVRVSQALEKNRNCFICNSDDLDFDSFVWAINGDEQLHPGQLYFALPMSWLEKPLRAEEMACLAVKASMALKTSTLGHRRCCGSSCGLKRVDDVMYSTTTSNKVLVSNHVSHDQLVGGRSEGSRVVGSRRRGFVEKKKRRGGGSGSLTTKLNVILEE
ncbi:hypothetical protein ACOSP7_005454 [Xanthoceras sorbifolium]|uniref:Uncharacterized protein n=1 Tax=Xanthoceras sorbifolium TaxID=99658 RepID=A0ABQ8IF60_9ROSI|nr:hypothetical protein JRO89_XS02G0053500 [Xanthoceras sorbifolium]